MGVGAPAQPADCDGSLVVGNRAVQAGVGVYEGGGGNDMDEELVSIRTLADVLDCSPKTIRDWMYRNRRAPVPDPLPYYRLGGLVRFRLQEVMAWIGRRRVRISPLSSADATPRPRRRA